jgi:hypothetical protein
MVACPGDCPRFSGDDIVQIWYFGSLASYQYEVAFRSGEAIGREDGVLRR